MSSPSPTSVLLGIVAILFGLTAAYGVHAYMSNEPEPVPVVKPVAAKPVAPQVTPMTRVTIAKVNIPPYTQLSEENLLSTEIPTEVFMKYNNPESGIVFDQKRLIGRVTKTSIMAGSFFAEKLLYEFGKVPTLEEKLNEGETALTIPVSGTSSVSGYLHPEAKVNVLLTVSGDKHPDLPDMTTVTLFKNVRVLATNEDLFPYNPGDQKMVREIVVAVRPETANKLVVAQRYGTLSVTLSRPEDAGELIDAGPAEKIAPLDLFGLDAPEADMSGSYTTDVWTSTSKHTNNFGTAEVLESVNATRVSASLPPLKKLPKRGVNPDTVME